MRATCNCRLSFLFLFVLAGCGGSGDGPADAGTDAGTDAGFDGGGDSGPVHLPGYPGSACRVDADCLFEGDCLSPIEGFPGGFCVVFDCQADSCPDGSECFQFSAGGSGCIPTCTDSSQCRQDHGYLCDADNTCWPGAGTVPPGGPCGYASQCQGGANAVCILHMGFLDGYCLINSCGASCPEGSECREALGSNAYACLPSCQSDHDCRTGYTCPARVHAGSGHHHAQAQSRRPRELTFRRRSLSAQVGLLPQ